MHATRRWPLIAVSALACVWALAPAAVPLYDGPGGPPDEPYRYVVPPTAYRHTAPPTAGASSFAVSHGLTPGGYVNTAEFGPQASLYVPADVLLVPIGTSHVTVRVAPVRPSPPLPADGRLAGNVYDLSAVASTGLVALRQGANPTLALRAPSGRQPGPVFEHRVGNNWVRPGRTLRVGVDVYQTQVTALGDWALVQLAGQTSLPSEPGINLGLLVSGVLLLTASLTVLLVRRRRLEPSGSQGSSPE